MSNLITELGYVGFEVSDLSRWDRFGREVLGMDVIPGPAASTRWLRMDERPYRIILTEGPADDLAFAGWQVPDESALEGFAKHLESLDLEYRHASAEDLSLRQVAGMLHFVDPNGARHEVFYGAPSTRSHFKSDIVPGGFVTGDGGLGHIVFATSQYQASVDFAQKVIGMDLSDTIVLKPRPDVSLEFAFLHINSRHHSMAFAAVPGGKKRMHHFMVEVQTVPEVGMARDRCLEMGQPVLNDIGQHPNDQMISFYGQTPSGFLVEYGCGGVLVRKPWEVQNYPQISSWGHRPAPLPTKLGPKGPATDAAEATAVDSTQAAGHWDVVVQTPLGEQKVTFDLKVDGGIVTGLIEDLHESNEVLDGTAAGNTLRWRMKTERPMRMDVDFTATFAGNTVTGSAQGPLGTAPFSGSRV